MLLQRAQNAAIWLMLSLDHRSSITTALRHLHWLPVNHHITFKVATVMHQALHHRCSPYMADLVAFSSTNSQQQLRSTTTRAATIQRTWTQFWRRAFSVCGPDVWNSLPPSVLTVNSDSSFHRAIKPHLFQLAYKHSILFYHFLTKQCTVSRILSSMTGHYNIFIISYNITSNYQQLKNLTWHKP